MWMQTIWMEYADSGEIAMSDMGSGRVVDAIVFGPRSNKGRIGDVEAGFFSDETAIDNLRAQI
jgi:hypothetical protein